MKAMSVVLRWCLVLCNILCWRMLAMLIKNLVYEQQKSSRSLPASVSSLSVSAVIIVDAIVSIGGAIKSVESVSVGEIRSVEGIFNSSGGDTCEARILLWESTIKDKIRIKIVLFFIS